MMSQIQIGLDEKTGFPCIGLPGAPDYFVALLPVTKMQVEQFICEADVPQSGWTMAELYGHVGELVGNDYSYTDTYRLNGEESVLLTDLLRRIALSEEPVPEAVLAGNIPFAHPNFRGATNVFPSSGTPGESLLAWLGARSGGTTAPSLPTEAEYNRIRIAYRHFAGDYLRTVLNAYKDELKRRTKYILRQLLEDERIASKQLGLPFLDGGLWELTGQSTAMSVWAGANPGRHPRPQAIGSSPYLSRFYQQHRGVRRILIPHHPCIGMRPVLPETSLRDDTIREVPLKSSE